VDLLLYQWGSMMNTWWVYMQEMKWDATQGVQLTDLLVLPIAGFLGMDVGDG